MTAAPNRPRWWAPWRRTPPVAPAASPPSPPATAIPPVEGTCDPRVPLRSSFTGALLPVCGVDVLVVVVQPRIVEDPFEANLYVTAFHLRFQRTIVLMAQANAGTQEPTFYGPAGIVHALSTLPFELIPWQRMLYRMPRPRAWQLPIPPERPSETSCAASETDHSTGSYSSSIEELARTCIRTRDDPAAQVVREAAAAAAPPPKPSRSPRDPAAVTRQLRACDRDVIPR